MASVFLVEDHVIFAQSLRRLPHEKGHLDVVAVARSAEKALEKIPELEVDLVLVDVSLPQRSGISLVLLLHKQYPDLLCVMLCGRAEGILTGIRRVLAGEIYVSEELWSLR